MTDESKRGSLDLPGCWLHSCSVNVISPNESPCLLSFRAFLWPRKGSISSPCGRGCQSHQCPRVPAGAELHPGTGAGPRAAECAVPGWAMCCLCSVGFLRSPHFPYEMKTVSSEPGLPKRGATNCAWPDPGRTGNQHMCNFHVRAHCELLSGSMWLE